MNLHSPLKVMALFAAVQAYAFSVSAQGVIPNDAEIFPQGSRIYLSLVKSLQGRVGLFAIEITSNSVSQYTFSYAGIAEEYALYAVNPGTTIDPAFATTTTRLVSNNLSYPGSTVQSFSLGQSRYFAYWDDRWYDSHVGYGVSDVTDHYGWVQITRTLSGLQASSGATAIRGGIIAGTFTQVPEPSAEVLSLLGIGVSMSFFGFRRQT